MTPGGWARSPLAGGADSGDFAAAVAWTFASSAEVTGPDACGGGAFAVDDASDPGTRSFPASASCGRPKRGDGGARRLTGASSRLDGTALPAGAGAAGA